MDYTNRDCLLCPCNIALIQNYSCLASILPYQCLYGNGIRSCAICAWFFKCNIIGGSSIYFFKILCLENVEPYRRCEVMKAIRLSFFQMLAYMQRDMMLFAICLAPILAGLLFRFAIPLLEDALTDCFDISAIIFPYYALLDIFFAMLSPTMFCFVSAMVSLEEADEKTAVYLFVTPLGKTGYLTARFGIPVIVAFLVTAVLLPIFKLTSLSSVDITLLAAGGTLQGIIISLLIVTISSNKLEGMAVTKLSGLMIFGAAIPFFIKHNVQYVIFLLPSFWIGKAIFENMPFYMLPAFVLSAIWIYFLLKKYLRKI